ERQLIERPLEAKLGDGAAERLVGDLEGLARGRETIGHRAPHADLLRALPREQPGELHHRKHLMSGARLPQEQERVARDQTRTMAVPHEMPAPSAQSSTICPGLIRPSRIASSRATGIEALEVLPYSSMFNTNFSSGKPSRSDTWLMIRRFAWC